jgi:hypothetical protein
VDSTHWRVTIILFTQETGSGCFRVDHWNSMFIVVVISGQLILHLGKRSCPITGMQGTGSLNHEHIIPGCPLEFAVVSRWPGKRRRTRIDKGPRSFVVGLQVWEMIGDGRRSFSFSTTAQPLQRSITTSLGPRCRAHESRVRCQETWPKTNVLKSFAPRRLKPGAVMRHLSCRTLSLRY